MSFFRILTFPFISSLLSLSRVLSFPSFLFSTCLPSFHHLFRIYLFLSVFSFVASKFIVFLPFHLSFPLYKFFFYFSISPPLPRFLCLLFLSLFIPLSLPFFVPDFVKSPHSISFSRSAEFAHFLRTCFNPL
jgi:hypothetical protein